MTRRLAWAFSALFAGAVGAVWGAPLVHANDLAVSMIVTVFAILAGFLIAIMGILGDASLLIPGSWRVAEIQRGQISKKLIRQKYLFYVYLVIAVLVVISALTKNDFPLASVVIARVYMFFAGVGTVLSFRLPSTLMEIQLERVDTVIRARKADGTKSDLRSKE